jgi:hypothetical protein
MSIFDGDWHSYAQDPLSDILMPDGLFHFEVDPNTHELVNSTHSGMAIRGSVDDAARTIVIYDDTTTYYGTYSHQEQINGKPVYFGCGKFVLPIAVVERKAKGGSTLRMRFSDQIEGTWVITKP